MVGIYKKKRKEKKNEYQLRSPSHTVQCHTRSAWYELVHAFHVTEL